MVAGSSRAISLAMTTHRPPTAPVDDATLAALARAMLPLDGAIAEHARAILDDAAGVLPPDAWRRLTYVDLTAGSCLLPMAFAAAGAARIVVNDPAPRTTLAARALFGGRPVALSAVAAQLAGGAASLRPHVPSFHFLCDYFPESACAVFDRLFHAALPPAEAHALRYLALRWMLGFAPSAEEDFRLLETHDLAQLAADRTADWRPFLARLADPGGVLAALAADINAGIAAVGAPAVEIRSADMTDVARDFAAPGACPEPCLVAANPPTNGLDEYVVDDQIAHSLIANRLVPLARSPESAASFWTRRIEGSLAPLPAGTFFLVWGGDGALDAAACRAVWARFGRPLVERPAGDGRRGAVWAIHRRE